MHLYSGCSMEKTSRTLLRSDEEIQQTHLLFHYDVKFYHLDLHVETDTTFLSGSVTIQAQVIASTMDTFAVELIDEMTIDSILINGAVHDFYRQQDEVFVPLIQPVSQGELFTSRIYYNGTPPSGNFFIGVSRGYDETWEKPVIWTLSEPFNARQWWPTKQVLSDKADSVKVFITTDSENKAGSIGLLEQVVVLPGNKLRYEWKSNYPIAYYLISYAVAPYQDYTIYAKPTVLQEDSIPVQNFIYDAPGCLEFYKDGIDRTVEMIELFSDLYSLYPFYEEKYGHCLTLLSGGMEHQTMTTIGNFGLGLVGHELAHMWFGNQVTCATWSDIWINEGFATYSDYLVHEKIAAPQWAPIWLNNVHDYIVEEPDGSVYVSPEEITYGNENRIFDARLSYYKGAYLLHMIRYTLKNDNLFFEAFRNFQTAFKDSVATADDFMNVLNSTTGQDFTLFFDQWFYGEGYPIYNIDWSETDGNFLITSLQSSSASNVTPFFNMTYPVKVFMNDATDTIIEIIHTQPLAEKSVLLNAGVDSIQVDPDRWVLKKVGSINGIYSPKTTGWFELYPNPVSDQLFLRFEGNQEVTVAVFNGSGKMIQQKKTHAKETGVSMKSLKPGIYYLKIESKGNTSVQKIIKH